MLLYCFYFSPDSFQEGYETERVMRTITWRVGTRGDKEGGGGLKRSEKGEEWYEGMEWGSNRSHYRFR